MPFNTKAIINGFIYPPQLAAMSLHHALNNLCFNSELM